MIHRHFSTAILLILTMFSVQFLTAKDSIPEKKYPSLLWKITGNGLEKPSYLYGTMHVSRKIAYRLDDVFYEALLNADAVAVESTPDTWLDYINRSPEFRSSLAYRLIFDGEGFYRNAFEIKSPEVLEITQLLGSQDFFLNAILYRMESQRNLEEDTYLDMFIYQAGKKFEKPAYSLEDVEESNYLVSRSQIYSIKTKPSVWLQKKLEDREYNELLEDAYRRRDLDVIDSIMTGGYTEHHLKYMLRIRNYNMMQTLDSLMQHTGRSIFAGIGAAHLPGENGSIEILRRMGYTVVPYTSERTGVAKQMREKIESTFHKQAYRTYTMDDGLFSLKAPSAFTEINLGAYRVFISPDLDNGAYVIVTRIHLFNPLNKTKKITFETVKGMIYEATHGKILSQKETVIDGFPAIEVRNKTKEKDDQRYLFVYTPLELIVVKMGGKKGFVSQYGDEVFESIRFDLPEEDFVRIEPPHHEYTLKVPALHSFDNPAHFGRRIIEGIDRNRDNYYFMVEQLINDVEYLEEDRFELTQIQRRFYEKLKLDVPDGGTFSSTGDPTYRSAAQFDAQKGDSLYLMTRIRGNHYFLLGMLGKEPQAANAYFDSFEIQTPTYFEPFEMHKDTSLYFSAKMPVIPPDTYTNYYSNREKTEKDKPYMGFSRDNIYLSDANESISVDFYKFNDYASYENLDSLWNTTLEYYEKNLSFIVKSHHNSTLPGGYPYLEARFTDTLTGRSVWLKKILAHDRKYSLRTLTDSLHEPSEFVKQFYESFTPYDTLLGQDVLEDKIPAFLEALRQNDSLVFDTYRILDIRRSHFGLLRRFIRDFHFPKDKQKIRNFLVENIAGQIDKDDTGTLDFLDSLYTASYDNSYLQLAILNGLASNRENFYKKILELLEKDLPITTDESDISDLFDRINDHLPQAKNLFPGLLDFTTVSEYKEPIYYQLSVLKDSGYINKKHYKKFRRQLLTEAKIALKKVTSDTYTGDDDHYHYGKELNIEQLNHFISLLYPFRKEKNIREFLHQAGKADDNRIREKIVALHINYNEAYPSYMLDSVVNDLKTRWLLYYDLKEYGKLGKFPREFANQRAIAESMLFSDEDVFNEKTDTIVYLDSRDILVHDKPYRAYVFKTKKIKNNYLKDANPWKMHAIAFKREDMDPISVGKYLYSINVVMKDTETEEKQIEDILERVQWYDRKRVSFEYNPYY